MLVFADVLCELDIYRVCPILDSNILDIIAYVLESGADSTCVLSIYMSRHIGYVGFVFDDDDGNGDDDNVGDDDKVGDTDGDSVQ